jgi:hypothetical protein
MIKDWHDLLDEDDDTVLIANARDNYLAEYWGEIMRLPQATLELAVSMLGIRSRWSDVEEETKLDIEVKRRETL